MTRPADILVAGAGPTGLALALQAHDHGARVRIVDRRTDPFRPSRALIVHPRTLEALRPLGVTDAILARADTDPEIALHLGRRVLPARLGHLALPDTAFPHLTLVRQMDIEEVLLEALCRRGLAVERGVELIETGSDAHGATATLVTFDGRETVRVDALAGCDGPDSTVRRSAGIGWRGSPYREEIVLADLELEAGFAPGGPHAAVGREGLLILFPLGEQATWRLLATRRALGPPQPFGQPGPPVPIDALQAMLDRAGIDARIDTLPWSAAYRVQRRLADRFRAGNRFLVGDAAHGFSPATGQGLNTGIQDAINLGWKLAFAANASNRDALLDAFEAERRPAARRKLGITHMAFLMEASTTPIPALMRSLAPLGAPAVPFLLGRRRLLAEGIAWMGGLRAGYRESPLPTAPSDPLPAPPRVGDRLADATVLTDGGEHRLHALTASPGVHVLLHRDAAPIESASLGPLVTFHRLDDQPGTGLVALRPDGHVGFTDRVADADRLQTWLARIGAVEA